MLTLRIPKAEQVKPRQIRISPSGSGQTEAQASGPEAKVAEPANAGTRG